MPRYYFQLHDFFSFSVEGEPSRVARYLSEFAFFQVPNRPEGPLAIEVVVNDFQYSPPTNAITVNKKFTVSEDCLYAEDSYKVARWKIKIVGLDAETTKVQVYGNLPANIILARWFCETIIRLKMTLAGYAMIHSSCLADDSSGVVLAACPSTGKTTSLLTWLAMGKPFCSDEYSILKDGTVWSYVTPFRFHRHNLEMNPEVAANLSTVDRWQVIWRTALLKMTGGYADVTWNISLEKALPGTEVISSCRLDGLYVVTRSEGSAVEVRERSIDEMVTLLHTINQFEWFGFGPYIDAWKYAHPNSSVAQLADIECKSFQRELALTSYREIRVPRRFTKQTFQELLQVVGECSGA